MWVKKNSQRIRCVKKKKNLVSFSLPSTVLYNSTKKVQLVVPHSRAHKFVVALFVSFIEYCILYIPSKAIRKLLFKKCEPLFSTLNGSAKLNIPCFVCCTTKSSPFRHSFFVKKSFNNHRNRTKNVYKTILWDFYFKNVFILIGILYLFYLVKLNLFSG